MIKPKTELDWVMAMGHKPINDDLERCNCGKVGQHGHIDCGWCERSEKPRMMGGACKVSSESKRRMPWEGAAYREFLNMCRPCRLAVWAGWKEYRESLTANEIDWLPCEDFNEYLAFGY
tara:strand:- start:556 stop:912 length:357 start_codon:yes stop_codon:yes gene_type:complete